MHMIQAWTGGLLTNWLRRHWAEREPGGHAIEERHVMRAPRVCFALAASQSALVGGIPPRERRAIVERHVMRAPRVCFART